MNRYRQAATRNFAWGLAAMLLLSPMAVPTAQSQEVPWLMTPEEAAMAPARDQTAPEGVPLDIGRDVVDTGPIVEILKPSPGGRGAAPVEVVVKFKPRLDPVDLTSLKVHVMKFISIDITDRIKPFATANGIEIKEAMMPSGKHRVRITLADMAGGRTVTEVDFEVL